MQHTTPFRHPLASHAANTVLGYRRNGSPIYAIAGGNGEGEGDGGPPPAGEPTGQPPAPPTPPTGDDGTDWKAQARKWEARAKENSSAATELEKLRKASLSDQEKAVEAAKAEGRTAAARDYGARLATAEFKAAAAAAGVDLGDAADLINTSRFADDTGEVDTAAIAAAVKKLAKLAPAKGPGRSGGDMSGGNGGGPSLDDQIADAQKRRDHLAVIRLKRQKAAQT